MAIAVVTEWHRDNICLLYVIAQLFAPLPSGIRCSSAQYVNGRRSPHRKVPENASKVHSLISSPSQTALYRGVERGEICAPLLSQLTQCSGGEKKGKFA